MNLQILFGAVVAGFALLQWWALPRVEGAWVANQTVEKLTKASVIAALKAARTVLQLATVVYGSLLAAIWILDLTGNPATAEGLHSKIAFLEQLKEPIAFVKDSIVANLVFWSALLGLGYLVYKRHYADLTAQVTARVQSEIERLNSELEAGSWPDLPPTAGMTEIGRRIEEVRAYASKATGEQTKQIDAILEALQQQWVQADFFRRMNLAEQAPDETSLRGKLWPNIAAVITSRGFARDTGALAKACSYAATLLMLFSLVCIAGSGVDSELSDRIAHAWDLAVKANQKEAEAAWDKALDKYKNQNEEDRRPADTQQAQVLVRAFSRAYFISPTWQMKPEAARRAYLTEAAVARANVIAAEGAARKIPVQGKVDAQDHLLTSIRDATLEPSQPTPLEKRLTERLLKDTSKETSAIWRDFNTKIATFSAAYREPATVSHFTETLLGQVLDPVADALQPEATQAATKQFEKIISKGLKTALERSITTQFDRFLTDLAGNTPVESALTSVAQATPRDAVLTPREIPEIATLLENMDGEATRIHGTAAKIAFAESAFTPDDAGYMRRLAKIVHEAELRKLQFLESRGSRTSRPTMDFIATYEDYFANSEVSAASTPRAKLLAESGHALDPKQFAEAAARARNFEKLTVFNRVGGILIGRKSANGATLPERVLDGYSIRQEASDPGRIALVLRDGAGYEKRLGSYAPDVIYRALLFAADGRPLVVTIVNTELGGVQKVILHPVLIDTAIGCEMIELDKFVFSYIRKDIRDANSAEMRRVQGYDALYSLARLYGVRALVKAEYQPELDALISSYIEDHSRETLQSALRDPLLFSDIKRSPLAANYHIYGKPVIDAMKMCVAKRRDTLDAFGDCLTHAARTVTTNEQAREWLKQPKPLEFVSGVRDRSYSLDVDLKFLDGAAKTDTHGVLQFLIQDTDSTGDTDTNVWSFDSLTPAIEEGVKTLIKTNPQATTILRNSEDFAVLQRLFRLIFDGQLRGPQLLSQVASLAKQLGPQVKDKVSTARWNPSQSPIGVNEARSVAKSYEALGADAQSSAPTPPEVQSALTILAACADAARAPDRFMWASTWQAHCSFDNVRETLAASCRANLARDTLLCRLSAIANFANATWAKIKLAEVMGMPINATPEPKTPKACRAAL